MKAVMLSGAMCVLVGTAGLLSPSPAAAQGCEPIRFTAPVSLGGQGETYLPGHQWRATLAYRRLTSNQWFIGHDQSDALGPGGEAPVFKIHTFIADVAYSFNDRFSARISVPFSTGSLSRIWPDGAHHQQSATGIGDISLQGEAWLLHPATHRRGNIALGLGVKAPTGSHTRPSQFYLGSGPVDFPADQTIQPGDGGWALLMQLQGFQQLTGRVAFYGFGSYMASARATSDVTGAPAPAAGSGLLWAVPDVYSVRAGMAFDLLANQGLGVSLGGRMDGIPVHDLFGGGDSTTIKRTSRVIFVDPGLSLTRGRNSFTLSVPVRVSVNREKSIVEQQQAGNTNGGGFAKYLMFASYSRRF